MTRTPHHQGRALPRPDEEIVDQGLGFDLGTLFDRRRMLQLVGLGAVAAGATACGAASTTTAAASSSANASGLTEIPDETNGPYPADGTNGVDVLSESGIVRSDIRSSFGTSTTTAPGVPMTLRLTVLDIVKGGAPMTGAAVYVWQCDRAGDYSMYSDSIKNENYLRGVQIADASGTVSFTSIFPACYSGRWPHVHFEVYPDQASITDHDACICTSQVALPKDACDAVYAQAGYEASPAKLAELTLATDNVFGDDGGVHQLGTVTGDVNAGYTVALTVPIDTSTEPTGGNAPGGGGPGGAPPGGGGQGGGEGGPPPGDAPAN